MANQQTRTPEEAEAFRTYKREAARRHREDPENRERYNHYQNEWRKKNPEKVREYRERHYLKKAREIQARRSEG